MPSLKASLEYWSNHSNRLVAMFTSGKRQVLWEQVIAYFLFHLSCLAVFWVGFSWFAFWVAILLYILRTFAITAFFHRYFAHRAFQTTRVWQFIFAVLGSSVGQRGPLLWAGHHRLHHQHVETADDIHSPTVHGFCWSHSGWFMSKEGTATPFDAVRDFAKYPELRWIDRYAWLNLIVVGVCLYTLGSILQHQIPGLHTNGWQLFVWGFSISTLCQHHATCAINSVGHLIGTRSYETRDNSRNNAVLALLTLGEGWHNNHHRFPSSAQQGISWWQLDITYEILKVMAWLGIIWNLKTVKTLKDSCSV